MIMSLVFIIQFKKMHIKFFLSIHKQITDIIFIKYYQKKLEQLSILLELYREPPMVIIEKINQIKKLEHSRKQKENKNQSKPKLIYVTGPIPKDKQNHEEQSHEINKNTLNNTYKKIYLSPFFLKIFIYSIKHRNTGDLEVSSKTKIVVLHLKELIYLMNYSI